MKTPLRKSFATTLAALLTAIGASQPVACNDAEENQPGDSGANLNPQGAGAGGTGVGSGVQVKLGACLNPEPHEGEGSGWVKCAGKIWHKNGPSQCKPHPPATLVEDPGAACQSDSDCSQLPSGKCWTESGFFWSHRQCVSECVTDGDCAQGETCFCGSNVNRCIPSNCRQDSDCGEGLFCKATIRHCSYEVYTAICETAQDPCSKNSDCSGVCYPDSSSWQCQGAAGCGRPLAVGEGYSVASLARGGGWA